MARDVDKLLGGYATGTLTEEERRALFEAALDDQQLFDALADEEALKELLQDPASRRRLLETLETGPSRTSPGALAWLGETLRRPVRLTLAGSVVAAGIAVFVFLNLLRDTPREAEPPLAVRTTQESLEKRAASTPAEEEPPSARYAGTAAAPEPRPPAAPAPPDPSGRLGKASMDAAETSSQEKARPGGLRHLRPSPEVRYAFSVAQPFTDGPARELFFASSDLRGGEQASAGAARDRSSGVGRVPESTTRRSAAPPPRPAELRATTTAAARMGLRVALEKEGPGGLYQGIGLDAPLGEQDSLRLTAEANTDGYLYVAQERDGRWHRLFPSFEGAASELARARVRRGQRVIVPLIAFAHEKNGLLIVLSRNEMEGFAATPAWRSPGGERPIIRDQRPDKTIYFAPAAPDATTPLLIRFDIESS